MPPTVGASADDKKFAMHWSRNTMPIPKVVLSAAMETLRSLNQTCVVSAQSITEITQNQGAETICDNANANATISGLNVQQNVTSEADCVMIAGSAQRKELMSEAMRERYASGIADFVAQNSGDDKIVNAINEISDTLSSSAFSSCYAEANSKIKVLQSNACENIIVNTNINQSAEAIVNKCLLSNVSDSTRKALLNVVDSSDDVKDDTCEPLSETGYDVVLIGLSIVVAGLAISFLIILYKFATPDNNPPADIGQDSNNDNTKFEA